MLFHYVKLSGSPVTLLQEDKASKEIYACNTLTGDIAEVIILKNGEIGIVFSTKDGKRITRPLQNQANEQLTVDNLNDCTYQPLLVKILNNEQNPRPTRTRDPKGTRRFDDGYWVVFGANRVIVYVSIVHPSERSENGGFRAGRTCKAITIVYTYQKDAQGNFLYKSMTVEVGYVRAVENHLFDRDNEQECPLSRDLIKALEFTQPGSSYRTTKKIISFWTIAMSRNMKELFVQHNIPISKNGKFTAPLRCEDARNNLQKLLECLSGPLSTAPPMYF